MHLTKGNSNMIKFISYNSR